MRALFSLLLLTIVFGCGSDEASGTSATSPAPTTTEGPDPSASVSQPGAQDFGLFRQALEAGEIPSPDLVDDMGFFAEHKLDYPPASCAGPVCLHGLVGVMGNMLNGVDCTLIQVGMNSALDPEALKRPSMHVVIVLDTSGSMIGEPIDYMREGLLRMLDSLGAADFLSVVAYGGDAELLIDHAALDDRIAIEAAIVGIEANGKTNTFAGLFDGYTQALQHVAPGVETRVILLSDGLPTVGIGSPDSLRALVDDHARQGIGLTTIGVGVDFGVDLMRTLAEVGAGNFYFLEDPKAMVEVFTDEVGTFLAPIATNVRLEVNLGSGYLLGDAYGTRGFRVDSDGGWVDIPVLFLGGRRSAAEPITEGRRGGGGAILFELLRRRAEEDLPPYDFVGRLRLTYTDPATGKEHEQKVNLELPADAAETVPVDGWFSSPTVEKGFVMLNLFAAFRLAAELARDADTGSAIGTLQAIRAAAGDWALENEDPDIDDDLDYVDLFVTALQRNATTPVQAAANPWPYD